MRHAIVVLVVAAAAASVLGGCAGPPRDVTGEPEYHGGYVPRQVYVLVRDAAAIGRPDRPVFLYRPEDLPPEGKYPAGHYTLVPAGSRIRVTKFVFEDTQVMPTMWEYILRVYGEMLDGPLAGKSAELHGLSEQRPDRSYFYPNPALLQASGEKAP